MKIPHWKLSQGVYLFPGGSVFLIVNKYWGSSCFPVNDYWAVIFFWGVLTNGYTGPNLEILNPPVKNLRIPLHNLLSSNPK